MNKVDMNYKTESVFQNFHRKADAKPVHVESHYYFLQPSQTVDIPKERE